MRDRQVGDIVHADDALERPELDGIILLWRLRLGLGRLLGHLVLVHEIDDFVFALFLDVRRLEHYWFLGGFSLGGVGPARRRGTRCRRRRGTP